MKKEREIDEKNRVNRKFANLNETLIMEAGLHIYYQYLVFITKPRFHTPNMHINS